MEITRDQVMLEFMTAIAPTLVQSGLALQKRLSELGVDAENCTSKGQNIMSAYANYASDWAEAMTNEYINKINQ